MPDGSGEGPSPGTRNTDQLVVLKVCVSSHAPPFTLNLPAALVGSDW
jgi:hypothetical protein